MALAVVMIVSFTVASQDLVTFGQAASDARRAVAVGYLENEAARVRNAFDPSDPASYLTNYPSSVGTVNSSSNVALGGDAARKAGACPYVANVNRTLVSQGNLASGVTFSKYRIDVLLPVKRGGTWTNDTLTREIDRVFRK